ncbi:unnamed protein product [Nippostrongylus brasiliensis]|uniref:Uncharacterized protein n=1 Tax=Nippostrongylus brasiliensis TaxID=27835 RepID=A0A0N4XK69_NIPBR|nr:unnamed protein product [Nippostrongylus brasiliensis]
MKIAPCTCPNHRILDLTESSRITCLFYFGRKQAEKDPSNTVVMFLQTPFYVNKGLIEAHGSRKFSRTRDGHLHAFFTREMEDECARGGLLPGEVLVALLSSMYPLGPQVPSQFLRAAIVFCHDHEWIHMKNKLEQWLLQQPPDSYEAYRDQIIFAERFRLLNMLSVSVQRAEGSCNCFADQLRKSDDFHSLSSPTQDLIVDRLCSGWGLEPKFVNKLATRYPTIVMPFITYQKKRLCLIMRI